MRWEISTAAPSVNTDGDGIRLFCGGRYYFPWRRRCPCWLVATETTHHPPAARRHSQQVASCPSSCVPAAAAPFAGICSCTYVQHVGSKAHAGAPRVVARLIHRLVPSCRGRARTDSPRGSRKAGRKPRASSDCCSYRLGANGASCVYLRRPVAEIHGHLPAIPATPTFLRPCVAAVSEIRVQTSHQSSPSSKPGDPPVAVAARGGRSISCRPFRFGKYPC